MTDLIIENIRIDDEIGDGIAFTVDVHGAAHRFFVARETLGEVEHSLLTNNHDMVASFERQRGKVHRAVMETLKLGASHNITFLKTAFFVSANAAQGTHEHTKYLRDQK
jgi:hypothetical protein